MVTILVKLAHSHGEISDEDEERAVEAIIPLLEQARKIGQHHAAVARLLIGYDPASIARSVVRAYIGRLKDRVIEIFHPSSPGKEPIPANEPDEEENWQSFDEWAGTLAQTVAETEIPAALEQGVRDGFLEQGERQMVWNVQDGACTRCQENADFGPIDTGDVFPSGDEFPPAHPHCRCSLGLP